MKLFNWRSKSGASNTKSVDTSSPSFKESLRDYFAGGGQISSESAMRISTVYACVKVLTDAISTLPLQLYVKDGNNNNLVDSRLASLLGSSPNSFQTSVEWLALQVLNICLRGQSFSYIVRSSDGRIVEILPLPPGAVAVNVTAQNSINYSITLGRDGETQTMIAQPNEILHLKNLTMDGVNGVSPIKFNESVLGHAVDARDYSKNVFKNGATPRGVLEVDGTLSDAAYENIKDSWHDSHQGTANSNKVAILESGVKWRSVSLSPEDVQLLDSRKYTRSEICGIFRVPPHMIGDLERATYSNIGHQSLEFYKSTVYPWLVQIESRLNFSLLSKSNYFFKFDVSELLRGDLESEVKAWRSFIEMAVVSPNEVRAKIGMNPREGGDEFVSMSNNLQFGNDTEEEPKEEPNAESV